MSDYEHARQLADLHAEIARLRADLDRVTRGTWSKELARLSAINADLRADNEALRAENKSLRRAQVHMAAFRRTLDEALPNAPAVLARIHENPAYTLAGATAAFADVTTEQK